MHTSSSTTLAAFFTLKTNGSFESFLLPYLDKYAATKEKGYIGIFTGNHDMPRISYRRTQEELKLAYAFILTMPGVPFVYYGDEIGLPYNDALPSKEGGYNRTGSRTPMQWSHGPKGYRHADAYRLQVMFPTSFWLRSARIGDGKSNDFFKR